METKYLCFLLMLLCALEIKSEDIDCYWREYDNAIPEDAYPAGKDTNDKDIYIGQVYVNGYGLYVGPIFPGTREVEVSAYGYRKTNQNIKILCTKHQNNLFWLDQSTVTGREDVYLIVGGYDHVNNKTLYIGRTKQKGILKVGNVSHFRSPLWFGEGNKDANVADYEILVYDKNNSDEVYKTA